SSESIARRFVWLELEQIVFLQSVAPFDHEQFGIGGNRLVVLLQADDFHEMSAAIAHADRDVKFVPRGQPFLFPLLVYFGFPLPRYDDGRWILVLEQRGLGYGQPLPLGLSLDLD